MVSTTPVTPAMWPGLLTLKFPTGEGALTAGLEGRQSVIRGTDPAPAAPEPEPVDDGNNPFIPDAIEHPFAETVSAVMKNGLIAITGIIIIAIGLLALVLQSKGGSLAS